ncbi:MAG TPA: GntR family transcriptional regulator [Solirubrobacteraceae bacterium]|nr:GntR family transcriptional regulator [Solirubrobacteraceae bacterium]
MTTSSGSSLRHRIADLLRERLTADEFPAGSQLPSEPELARSLGVSRSSLRAAIALLEADGLVRRIHGSGTYVTHRPVLHNDLSRNFGVSDMIGTTGLEPGTIREQAAREPAPEGVAAAFGVEPGTPLSVVRRVRTAAGRPVVDTTDWCREEVLDPSELSALAGGSIYAALTEQGLAIHHGVASISPTVATAAIARRLDVPRGRLLLTLFQVDSTVLGEVVLVSLEHHLADAFEISVYRRGPGDITEPSP